MPSQHYGKFSRLIPPLSIGGVAYGGFVQFVPQPAAPVADILIVSGIVDQVIDLGGGYKRIVVRREFQMDSRTITAGLGNVFEETFPVLAGGSVAQTHEGQRLYSHANPRGFRGSDSFDRGQAGDAIFWEGMGFLATVVEAFAHAPDEVSWQGDEHLPRSLFREIGINELGLAVPDTTGENKDARVYFPEDSDGVFSEAGVFVFDGPTPVRMTRKIFERPSDSEPDAFWYPPDAEFDDEEPQYWIDPASWEIRVGSATEDTGNVLAAVCWHGPIVAAQEASAKWVLDSTGLGYGITSGTEDSVGLASMQTTENFNQVAIRVYEQGTNGFGGGALEWRAGSGPSAALVAVEFSSGGVFTSARVRASSGAAIASPAFTANGAAFTGSFFVRFTKVAGEITVEWSPDGTTWTTCIVASLTGVQQNTAGLLSAATWDDRQILVSGWIAGGTVRLVPFSPAVLWRQAVTFWNPVDYSETFEVPGTTDITHVELERRLANGALDYHELSVSGTPARDHYTMSGRTITVTSELAGDRLRIRLEAEEGSPPVPGRPPRMGGRVNAATMSGTDGVGTTNVNENRFNWRDGITIHDPHGEFAAVPGDTFEVRRGRYPVWDSRNPPTIRVDTRDDTGTDWASLSGGNMLMRAVEALVLLKQDWIDAQPADAVVCFEAEGTGFVQTGAGTARMHNDLERAIDALSECWIAIGVGGPSTGVSGWVTAEGACPTSWTCTNCEADCVRNTIGVEVGYFTADVDALTTYGASWPHWDSRLGPVEYRDVVGVGNPMQFTSAEWQQWLPCCPDNPSSGGRGKAWIGLPGAGIVAVRPFEALPTSHAGAFAEQDGGIGELGVYQPSFSFTGVPFNYQEVLRRLPRGSVCLEAKAPVLMIGAQFQRWRFENVSHYVGFHATSVASTFTRQYWFHGELRARRVVVDGELVEEFDDPDVLPFRSSGTMGFTLMGRRLNSKEVELPLSRERGPGGVDLGPTKLAVPASQWAAFGGGLNVGGSVQSGKWCIVDVTAPINALLGIAQIGAYRDFQLWPTRAGVNPGSGIGTLQALAVGLRPDQWCQDTVDVIDGARHHTFEHGGEGDYITWDTMQVGTIHARFRLPSGAVESFLVPINWPAAMPG